jgi:hypothetical protein
MFWAKLGTRSEQRLNQEVRAHFIGPQELLVLRWDLSSCFSPNTVSLNRISTFLKPRLGGNVGSHPYSVHQDDGYEASRSRTSVVCYGR